MPETVPNESAAATLLDALLSLHRDNGSPSDALLVETIGRRRISESTVSEILRGEELGGWPKVRLVVEALGGDLSQFRRLWQAAQTERPPGATEPAAEVNEGTRFASEEDGEAHVSNGDLLTMFSIYRHPEVHGRAVSGEADDEETFTDLSGEAAKAWGEVQRLSDMSPDGAAAEIGKMPARQAAMILAELPDVHAQSTARSLGRDVVLNLLDALPPSQQSQRLTDLLPPDLSASGMRGRKPLAPADQVADIIANDPNLARQWGWLP